MSDPRAADRRLREWQPIETVPQDRRWVLVWGEDIEYCVYRFGPGLIDAEEPQPTHWMPLPDPPGLRGDAITPPRELTCENCGLHNCECRTGNEGDLGTP